MQGSQRFWTVLALGATLLATAGCRSQITNLTPTVVPREAAGIYHFEAEWTSNQRSRELRPDTQRGFVVIGSQLFPMERVPGMKDRWEGKVPLAPTNVVVFYQYKWDYGTAGFNRVVPNSLRSQPYRLEIAD